MSEEKMNSRSVAFVSDWQQRASRQQAKFHIVLATSLAIALAFCVLFFFWFQNKNHDRIIEQNMKFVQANGIHEANQVEARLDEGIRIIANIAGHYTTLTEAMPDARVTDRLEILTDHALFDRIGFIDRDGLDITLEGTSHVADRSYFRKGMQGESGYEFLDVSRVTGRSTMVFYAPVWEQEQIVGVMIGFYELERLDNIFAIEYFDYSPSAYLLQGDGSVIANSRKQHYFANILDELSKCNFPGDITYDDILEAIRSEARTSVTFYFYDDKGAPSVGVLTEFQSSKWMILSVLPSEMTSSMIRSANHLGWVLVIGISGVFLLLISLLLVFVYRQRNRVNQEIDRTISTLKQWMEHDRKQTFIVETLANTYSSVYHINIETSSYERIVENQTTTLGVVAPTGKWQDAFSVYREKFVDDDYLDATADFLEPGGFAGCLGDRESISVEFLRKDGGWRKIFLFPAQRDESGAMKSAIFAVQRIDEEKLRQLETQRALQDAYKAAQFASNAKTAFLSNMSHDIRTPMNAIIGMTAIAASNLGNTEKVSDCLRKITASCKHLLGLINEILDMSKIESGRVDLSEEEFSLSGLIDDLISMNQSLIKEKGHTLTVRVNSLDHEDVIGDRTRLQQVFTNLLTNAIKYTPAGGRLEIRVSELPSKKNSLGWYQVIIRDNGIGMSREFQKTLFDPFTRAADRRITDIQGTGLGMAIARNIVRMMNGDITVESELNRGSSFTVTFALRLQKEKDVDYSRFADLPVLVVDDDPSVCESTCLILSSMSMHAECAASGEEAVEMAVARHERQEDYYAVILDWKMPGMNGVDTARELRRRIGDQIPIIIISAYEWSDIEQEAREAGVDSFLSKPLFRSRIVELFAEMTGQRSKEEEQDALPEADFTGRRILLAEDNELNREIAVEILSMTGAEIDTAENGKLCLERFRSSAPGYYDVILMDIQMPVMDGYEAARAIRSCGHPRAASVPILAMTANAFTSDVRAAFDAGMNGHIAKPIDIASVMKAIGDVLPGLREK